MLSVSFFVWLYFVDISHIFQKCSFFPFVKKILKELLTIRMDYNQHVESKLCFVIFLKKIII